MTGRLNSIKLRWRLWLSIVVASAICASFLHPSVYWPVMGRIKGEAFYKDRPTSYWKSEALKLVAWQQERAAGMKPPERSWIRKLFPPDGPFLFTNTVLEGDETFQPVLTEMLNDADPNLRKLGEWGLSNLGSAERLLREQMKSENKGTATNKQ